MLKDTNDGAVTVNSSSSSSGSHPRNGSVIAACIERFRHHKPTSPTTRQRIAGRDDFFWQQEQRRQQNDDNTIIRLPTFPVDDDEWSFPAEGDSWKGNTSVQSSFRSKPSETMNQNDIMEQPTRGKEITPGGTGLDTVHRLDEYANNLLKKCDVLLHGFEQDGVNNNNMKTTKTNTTTKTTHRNGGLTSHHVLRISTDSMGDISIDSSSSSSDHDKGSHDFPDLNNQEEEDDDFTYSTTFTTTVATAIPTLQPTASSSSSSSFTIPPQQPLVLPETVPKKSYMTIEELQQLRKQESLPDDIHSSSSLFPTTNQDNQLSSTILMNHPPIVVSESTEFLFPAKHRLPLPYSQDREGEKDYSSQHKDKGSAEGYDTNKGLDKNKELGKDKDHGIDNLEDRMTKDESIVAGNGTDGVTGAISVDTNTPANTAAPVNTPTTTAAPAGGGGGGGVATAGAAAGVVVTTSSDPLPSDIDKDLPQEKGTDQDVLLVPLDASLSSVDLLMLAATGKNNRTDIHGLGSGTLYLSSSSEFERGTDGAISEGIRTVENSCDFEYSLPVPPIQSPVKSASQMVISSSNTTDEDIDVEPYLFDPVIQHLWSRLCHVREEMAKYAQQ